MGLNPAGLFNTDVLIQSTVQAQDGSGVMTNTWSDVLTCRGSIRVLSGDERQSATRESVISTHRVYINTTYVTEQNRLKINDKFYDIVYVNPMQNPGNFMQIDVRIVE